MPYIVNTKFNEILGAARNGNEKAMAVMQGMRSGGSQEDLDRLVNAYYAIDDAQPEEVIDDEPIAATEPETAPIPPELEAEAVTVDEQDVANDVMDLTDVLDKETEGLFDEDEYSSVSFADFLKNKKADANRMKKDSDYFKAFDVDGRNKYADGLIDKYRHKFDGNLRDVERDYADNDHAIDMYSQSVKDMLDDDIEFGTDSAAGAYNDLVENSAAMSGFARYWDNDDTSAVLSAIKGLVAQYGKANVIAALNVLKTDNGAHRDYLNNAIDANITKYSKNVDKLLR